ncbi:MAG: DUF3795 domain-containing protein [Bacteroidales bacterium]|jgi:hypothetical protein|nr:DUF3795 domain-containing protein [Bacteroidales bacterium]
MKTVIADKKNIAYCGLYCGACRKYQSGSCPGCHENSKASWCKVRSCNIERGYSSCADCTEFPNPMDCKKFNNFFSKIFALIFRSDRAACIAKIRESGYDGFAAYMAEHGLQSVRKN